MNAWKKSKGVLVGICLTLFLGALLGASNIVQNISWDSVSNSAKILFKDGGGTRWLASAKGVTDGSSPCAGCVGEIVNFAERSATTVTPGNYKAATTALTTLPPGYWTLYPYMYVVGKASLTYALSFISTNSADDSTGGTPFGDSGVRVYVGADTTAGITVPMKFGAISVSVATPIYAKVQTHGTTQQVYVGGWAVRTR